MPIVIRLDQALPADLRERFAAARSLGVITGAGISAESGIGTYRGAGGLYDDPVAGDETVRALSGPTFARDPDRTWRALAGLARAARDAAPNPAHRALVELERRFERFILLTQNVDGLHRRAGSRDVIEIHGHLFDLRCTGCGVGRALGAAELEGLSGAPRCVECGGVLRPEVVLFEEALPGRALARLEHEFLDSPPDAVLAIGTTALFPYIAAPVYAAAASGRLTIEVNPEETELSSVVTYRLAGPAGIWLPRLLA